MSDTPPHGITRRELRERAQEFKPANDQIRILMVCTGNVCRSPLAEVLLRSRVTGAPIRVHSAGTRALIDKPMTPDAQELAIAHGADTQEAGAHHARWLREPIAEDADLILAMSREHRSAAVELVPRMLRQTLTIREFARLSGALTDDDLRSTADAAGSSPRARLAAVTALISRQRGATAPAAPEDDDVIDPYRRSRETYETSAAQLVPAVDEVARVLHAAL
ncbi:low molecular weight phosphatase family protein [Microbacterium abyssi]|uniref:arsenate reductase/protein-tyrosine-phosphatase family protein n=1 Tax=Microbacterium abyssi TaxID=2782166 RepID=UPI001889A244|nr:low molecular weight phosphatase family protein [Microbacterium sp. A18JL241]